MNPEAAAVNKAFDLTPADKEIALELESLCRLYKLSAKDLSYKWQAFTMNTTQGRIKKPTKELARQLKLDLQREYERKLQARPAQATPMQLDFTDFAPSAGDSGDLVGDVVAQLFANNTQPSRPKPRAAAPRSVARGQPHTIESQHNPHLLVRGNVASDAPRVHIQRSISGNTRPFRYMFEKINDRSEALDERIDFIADAIEEAHGLENRLQNPTRAHQSEIHAVGRIRCDAAEGKLNEASLLFETSREVGMGKCVKLNVRQLDDYSLFPGQIIGFEGINSTGQEFVARKILSPPLPPKDSEPSKDNEEKIIEVKPDDLYRYNYGPLMQGKPMELFVAAGPYTMDTNLEYAPLHALIEECVAQKPDVVIMLGPFVSAHHPAIVDGTVDQLPEDIFAEKVAPLLAHLLENSPITRILLVPHQDDLLHTHPVLPQPAPQLDALTDLARIEILSNPAKVFINGCLFAFNNTDVLKHISGEEVSKSSAQTDRMARLCRHLLEQRSFYPLFPSAPGVNIDSDRLTDLMIKKRPDVLVCPSQLKQFARVVDTSLCVNPGMLCRGQAFGTYVRLIVHPLPNRGGSVGSDANVVDRTRVDIIKL
ncbi:DNA polymerase alpha/epsilon subunit B-domain-containing protein [Syncephalastrum racemosum]|uniref:DNA polymerase alpha subunit B n=1 Tax=Syncephalastrum racemosum TaxID=13706 RepID=A0A1X2HEY3_SYNRA|nr:DNA polymerase alpha/epsilon subunit B-domain-containing protein [Syncephalastrum racemosum]